MNLSPLANLDSVDGSISENGKSVMNYMQLQHMNVANQRNELYMLNSELVNIWDLKVKFKIYVEIGFKCFIS